MAIIKAFVSHYDYMADEDTLRECPGLEMLTLGDLRALVAELTWQPIETAPLDGSPVLLFGEIEGSGTPTWVKARFKGDFDGDLKPYWHWGAPGYVGQVHNPTHWRSIQKPNPHARPRKE